jgi:hypothetical protein
MCAYAFFRDNYIGLPKDITNYIILFLLPSDEDVIFLKFAVYDDMVRRINYQYDLYTDIMCNPRRMKYRHWSSFPRFILRIKDDAIIRVGY